MKIEDVEPMMRVAYIPHHAPEAKEYGTVSSKSTQTVWVRFDAQVEKLGWDGTTSQACDPNDLEPA